MFFQGGAVGCQRAEHESSVVGHSRHLGQPQLLALVFRVAGREGIAAQAAVVCEGPAVVVAGEGAGVAPVRIAHPITTVRAAIVYQVDLAVAVAGHQHRFRADGLHDEVVGIGDLAFVADVYPGALPDLA
ncbi:hypothetical protein FQZ97_1079820 [compost metagenome]